MTFEPELPEEVRGDQFETATPVHVGEEVEVEEEGAEKEEEESATFDYSAIEIHTEETPTKETPTDTYPDVVTGSGIGADVVPEVFTDLDGGKTQEPGDQTATGTTTKTPYTFPVSSPAPTTPSGSALPGVSQPTTHWVSSYEDEEGSSNSGFGPSVQEGSADDASPTPAAGSRSDVMTDETEIGGTELPTSIPDTPPPPSTTTWTQTEDFEGSASGEDEASGQDPPEIPKFTSTLPPTYSTRHTQQPQPTAGSEVTDVPVFLPPISTVTEPGSGAEQLSGEGEVSGEHGGLVDLVPKAVTVTALPDVAAVRDQTTLTTDTRDITSEPSTPEYSTHPTDDKKHLAVTAEPASTTSVDHTELYGLQTEQQSTAASTQYVSQSDLSTTLPLYTFDHSPYSIPQWALIPDPSATPLPEADSVDYDSVPSLLESQPLTPKEIVATEEPESGTDSAYSVDASTVNIRGTWTSLLVICSELLQWCKHQQQLILLLHSLSLPVSELSSCLSRLQLTLQSAPWLMLLRLSSCSVSLQTLVSDTRELNHLFTATINLAEANELMCSVL